LYTTSAVEQSRDRAHSVIRMVDAYLADAYLAVRRDTIDLKHRMSFSNSRWILEHPIIDSLVDKSIDLLIIGNASYPSLKQLPR
jgi:hypothetical protein